MVGKSVWLHWTVLLVEVDINEWSFTSQDIVLVEMEKARFESTEWLLAL